MALAILRLPVAIDFLLARVGDEEDAVARLAVAALALHRYDDRIRERTAAAVSASGRASLLAFFKERFHVGG